MKQGQDTASGTVSLRALTDARNKWAALERSTILFGHQSIGVNIIDALRTIVKNHHGPQLRILEISRPISPGDPGFYHFKVGKNLDPESKNRDFATFIDNCGQGSVDIAFYKLCYVDIDENTDTDTTFASYRTNLERLKERHPQTTFVHITVPLVVVQSGPRVWLKKVIGRKIGGYDGNVQRNAYNEILRKAYMGVEPLFDLARYQSTKPDGSRMQFSIIGEKYFSLFPGYASDGRHLNKHGSDYIARELLDFLADTVARKHV